MKNAQQEVVRVAGAERIINNQHMICDDDVNYKPKVNYQPEFTYKGFRCKYFVQTIEQAGRLYNVNKPACEIGPGQWVSIENWLEEQMNKVVTITALFGVVFLSECSSITPVHSRFLQNCRKKR